MAAGTIVPIRLRVPRTRLRAAVPLRFLGAVLISLALVIAFGVPLLLSGITGFKLWLGEGTSMEPTFYAGDFMITRELPASELKPGDVVLFKSERAYVMHRIVSIAEGTGGGEAVLTTRGDNNPVNDAPVAAGDVDGKLVYHVSWLPRSPVDLSGTGIFVAEWLISVGLVTLGIVLRRYASPPRRVLRRVYGT
jgi:signal peptidase